MGVTHPETGAPQKSTAASRQFSKLDGTEKEGSNALEVQC